jgi:nicotinamidase/pyrazinamidase
MSRALLIIDFQNDFTSSGALEVPGGDVIAEPVKHLAGQFDHVFATATGIRPTTPPSRLRAGPGPCTASRGRTAPSSTRR